jgi:hypothetical protein
MNNVVDDFCDSFSPLVGGFSLELHDRRIYSLATRPGLDRSDS